ncbi:MAG: PIG-L family deacetylase [Spirochaetia bacterium]|nr:PIG-L family deacetylase [Spirochaetia bacterium]
MKSGIKKVLAIGAHPDDVEFSMGGTVKMLTESGCEVMILDITDGEPTPHGSPEIRKSESQKAAKILNVQRKTLEFDNRFLMDEIHIRKSIAGEIRLFKPDVIFAHYPMDAHPDHLAASSLSMAARFYGKLSYIDLPGERYFTPRIFYFFSVHLRISPQPDFCLDISPAIETKIQALLCYESQFHELSRKLSAETNEQKEDMVRSFITTQNRYWGNRIGTAFAEPFFSPEIIGFANLKGLIL